MNKKININFRIIILKYISEIYSNKGLEYDLYNNTALTADISPPLCAIPAFLQSYCFNSTPKYSLLNINSKIRNEAIMLLHTENKHYAFNIYILKIMKSYFGIQNGFIKKLNTNFRLYISTNKFLVSLCLLHIGFLKNLASYCSFYIGILHQSGSHFFSQTGTNFSIVKYFSIKKDQYYNFECNNILKSGSLQVLASLCFMSTGLLKNLASHFLFGRSLFKTDNILIVNKIHNLI